MRPPSFTPKTTLARGKTHLPSDAAALRNITASPGTSPNCVWEYAPID